MRLHPIAAALGRNKTGLILIATQIALTLAIVCNSVFIIQQRLDAMGRPSGLDEANGFSFRITPFRAGKPDMAQLATDMAAIRALPGVLDATPSNSTPLSGGGSSGGISRTSPDPEGKGKADANTAIYYVDDHGINTFGVNLVAGRNFAPEEVLPLLEEGPFAPGAVIVTQALGEKLFPGENPIGKTVYAFGPNRPSTIVGVIERMQAAWVTWDNVENAIFAPAHLPERRYVVRTQPGQRDVVMRDIEAKVRGLNDQRVVTAVRTFTEMRRESYRRDMAMTVMLTTVIACLVTITGLGIVGIVSFWVTSRTKQIGTRRALGARRRDVTRYFQLENLMITGAGLAAGALLAYGFNFWLMQQYELPRLAWYYVPLGALALAGLGQLAVLGPALRGASVPPAVATRSV